MSMLSGGRAGILQQGEMVDCVNILGRRFRVIASDGCPWNDELNGYEAAGGAYHLKRNEIWIDKNLDSERKVMFLIHEVLEIILRHHHSILEDDGQVTFSHDTFSAVCLEFYAAMRDAGLLMIEEGDE